MTSTELGWLVGSLRRRVWLVLLITLAGTALALWVGLRSPSIYTAQALLMIDSGRLDPVSASPTGESRPQLQPEAATVQLETAIQVIRSRGQVEQIVRELGLARDPEFAGAATDRLTTAWVPAPLRPLLDRLPAAWLTASGLAEPLPAMLRSGPEGEPTSAEVDAVIDRFELGLGVSQQGRALVLAISFSSVNPTKAARIANRVAELYIETQIRARRGDANRMTNWLAERVAILSGELERSEATAQRYRANHNLSDQHKTDITDQQLSEANRELTAAEADLAVRTARLRFIRELRDHGEPLDTLPEALASSVITELRRQEGVLAQRHADLLLSLGPRHPQLQQVLQEKQEIEDKIKGEVGRILANLANEAEVVKGRVQVLSARVASVSDRSTADEAAELQLHALEREAAANRQLYEDFLARYKQSREQLTLLAPVAEVISVASPPLRPSSLGTKLIGALGLLASATLGSVIAVLLERLDVGLRSEADVRAALDLPRLALVPSVPCRLGQPRPHVFALQHPLAAYTEALRAILIGLRLARRRREPARVVLVTSAVPAEGKTTLAVSLAIYAGHTGQRVILVDLDLRHPQVGATLGAHTMPGITEFLVGSYRLEDVVISDAKLQIDYLPAGGPVADPLLLLSGGGLDSLLAQLRRSYDHVIIDAPPVLAATDTRLLVGLADTVLFVVRWGVTARGLAQSAVSTLRAAGAELAGAVLTQVNMRKHIRYGFGDVDRNYRRYRRFYIR